MKIILQWTPDGVLIRAEHPDGQAGQGFAATIDEALEQARMMLDMDRHDHRRRVCPEMRHWSGDLIDLADGIVDSLCKRERES